MVEKLIDIINEICEGKGTSISKDQQKYEEINLRDDLGFDSFDLAQLTVVIEDEFDVDVFEDGIISTLGEIINKIQEN